MATLPEAMRSDARDARSAGSVLHMEVRAVERRLLTLFASSFIPWIKDEAASPFARDVGAPASISFDETAGDAQRVTLHLTLTWPSVSRVLEPPRDTPVGFPFPDESEIGTFEPPPAGADVRMLMASVLEESKRLRRGPASSVKLPDWIPAPLVDGAARGRRALARWTDAALGSAAAFLERSRPRGRQMAALVRAQSVRLLLRVRSASGIRPIRWAAAGLFAASVIYLGWPFALPATGPGARGIAAAANPPAPQPATVTAPSSEKAAAPQVASAQSEPEPAPAPGVAPAPVRTSGVVPSAMTIPSSSPNPARDTANLTRVRPSPPTAGYVGSLMITSEPQGAAVSVDGVPQGRTPLAITNLNVGSRVVRLDLPGHQRWSWAVSVVANRKTPLAVRLVPQASPPVQ